MIIIIFVIFLFFSNNILSYDIQSREFEKQIIKERKNLEKIEKDIQKKANAINKLKRKEEAVTSQLEKTKEELTVSKNSIWNLEKKINTKNKEIKKAKEKIREANYKLNVYKKELSYLLQNMYKYKNRGYLEYIIYAEDWCDLIKRYKFLTIIATNYAQIVKNIKYQKKIILEEEKILNNCFKNLAFLKDSESKVYKNKLEKEKRERSLLVKIKNDNDFYLKQIEYQKEASLCIKRLIENLEIQKKKREETSVLAKIKFQTGRGNLEWPINSRNVLRGFGKSKHEKFDAFVFNKGIDIGTTQEMAVFCVKTGKVVFADWFKGYGQMVMVDHGGGYYTLYSNLDRISTNNGSVINKKSPVGIVQGSSYLHFEVRINGNPVDPLLWLGN